MDVNYHGGRYWGHCFRKWDTEICCLLFLPPIWNECHPKSVLLHIRRQHCAFVSDIMNDLLRRIGTSCWWCSQHNSIQSHSRPVRVHYFKRRHFEMLWMVRENLRALSRVSDAWLFLYVDSCCVTSDWRKETKASRQATGLEVITLTDDHPVCH